MLQIGQRAVMGKAILAAVQLANEGVRVRMGHWTADRLMAHVSQVDLRAQRGVGLQKHRVLAGLPGHCLFDNSH
jgi:hypothetical protein